MKFWQRPKLTMRERADIESAAVERYKRHVDQPRMIQELRELRDEIDRLNAVADGLESLLHQAQPFVTDEEIAAVITAAIGPPPEMTTREGMVLTPAGTFAMARFEVPE